MWRVRCSLLEQYLSWRKVPQEQPMYRWPAQYSAEHCACVYYVGERVYIHFKIYRVMTILNIIGFYAYLPWTAALTCGTVIHTAPMRTVMSSWAVRIPYTLRRKPSVCKKNKLFSPTNTSHSLSLRATSACHTDTETPDFFPELPVERGPSNTDSRSIASYFPTDDL